MNATKTTEKPAAQTESAKADSVQRDVRRQAWMETQRLLGEAVIAVNALSSHLESVPDKPRMYKANRALHALWEIE